MGYLNRAIRERPVKAANTGLANLLWLLASSVSCPLVYACSGRKSRPSNSAGSYFGIGQTTIGLKRVILQLRACTQHHGRPTSCGDGQTVPHSCFLLLQRVPQDCIACGFRSPEFIYYSLGFRDVAGVAT